VRCPVSGVAVQVGAASIRVDFEGESYVVCCAGCAAQLQAAPLDFLQPVCR